ncbi:galactokinase (plasmid) [Lactiplantibacillus plantarum]|nr:galactokinase [Lactiplantibacillus plantarum]RXE78152.1 galactokinase [Lactiplantibacillus plantarum]RZN66990.1 galactokinase [Lactiplantibacillus plantarum]
MLTTIKKSIIVKPNKILVKLFTEGFFMNTSDLKQKFTEAFDTKP